VRSTGLVSYVDVGCVVWSTERTRTLPFGDSPLGGLVVEVVEKMNQETGEVDRAFLCFDHQATKPRIHWSTIAEREVDRHAIEAAAPSVLANAWRRLGEEVAYSKSLVRRRGPATAMEVRCTEAMRNLQAVVFGPDGVLHRELEQLAPGQPAASRPQHQPAPANWFID
jgi:hypothetical protein